MRRDPEHPIVDTMLDELLGGKQPPDLASQILHRLADPSTSDEPSREMVAIQSRKEKTAGRGRSASLAMAASLVLAATLLGVLLSRLSFQGSLPSDDVAEQPDSNSPAEQGEQIRPQPELAGPPNKLEPGAPLPVPEGQPGESQLASGDGVLPARETIPALPENKIVSEINEQLADSWVANEVQPAEPATDEEWCRRVFLRVIGRIPSASELQAFLASSSAERREELVTQLLQGEDYIEEYARHWTNVWTNTLIGRRGGMAADDLASRAGLQQFLRRSFQQNRPYDQIVYNLISAHGSNIPGAADYNGAVNFLLASIGKDTSLATARTSSLFLGRKLQCVQCHDHPFNEVAQERFWQLDAYFARMQVRRVESTGAVVLADGDPTSETGEADVEVYYERPDGQVKATSPAFLGESSLEGQRGKLSLRTELALRVRYSDELPSALVNRMWSHFFGHGFTSSVDDMGAHSPLSHPQLLATLSRQFEAHGYDLKALIRWIALSRPFGLSSQESDDNLADLPERGGLPLFSRYYTRSMQPEEVYQSLLMVAGVRRSETPFAAQQLAQRTWLGQFAQRMGNDEAEEANSFDGDVHQSLVMMNGPLMKRVTSPMESGVLGDVLKSDLPLPGKVEHMFMAAISRRPNEREKKMIGQMLAGASDPETVLEDIWWALLNSNEFILDH